MSFLSRTVDVCVASCAALRSISRLDSVSYSTAIIIIIIIIITILICTTTMIKLAVMILSHHHILIIHWSTVLVTVASPHK